jgi:hypothetical protein
MWINNENTGIDTYLQTLTYTHACMYVCNTHTYGNT